MKKINLHELYPDVYKEDTFVDVADEIQAIFQDAKRAEAAYDRKKYRYKAHYSLNCGDGIEHDALLKTLTPEVILEEKQQREQLYSAVMDLPKLQSKRIYARYYLGLSVSEIARVEGVSKSRISESIRHGLKRLSKILKNFRVGGTILLKLSGLSEARLLTQAFSTLTTT